jgi:hypothetical protein
MSHILTTPLQSEPRSSSCELKRKVWCKVYDETEQIL